MRNMSLAIPLLVLAMTTTGAAEPQPTAPAAPPPTDIEGQAWTLTAYRTAGALVEVVAMGRPARFIFANGEMSAVTGCNSLTGAYTWDEAILTIGPGLAATRMGCPAPLMAQEKAIIRALRQVAGAQRQGQRMDLLDAEGVVLLRFDGPATTALAGRTWRLELYNNAKQTLVTPVTGSEITLAFDGQGRVSGSDGCNQYMSGYTSDTNKLAIGPLATTRMGCRGGAERAEQARVYAKALGTVVGYRIVGPQLTLLNGDGKPVARFLMETSTVAQPQS